MEKRPSSATVLPTADQISFAIHDEREGHTGGPVRIGYFHPLETRALRDIYVKIFEALAIPAHEQETVSVSFRVNNERVLIRYPSELLGAEGIVATVADHDGSNAFSDSLETEKSRYVEEHINPMPYFPVHQSQATNPNVCLSFMYDPESRRRTRRVRATPTCTPSLPK